ncbi:MAG TPA: glycosyltransferase family 2 protein [Acidimicrobiales bacterium]
MRNPELSVVVPAYNEAGNIDEFLRRTVPILEANVRSYEIIFAVDPCTDGTEDIILARREENPSIKLLRFSRRFGQPTATLAGIEHATGDAVVVMDVDLQDPPELLVEMLEKWRDGYDVVYAKRRARDGETLIKRVVAKVGYAVINRFAEVPIPRDTGDFRLLDRRVVDELNRFKETHGFLRGLVALVGFEQTAVEFDRPARHSGSGNYNRFVGSLRIGFNGLVAFSSALLDLSTIVGAVSAALAFVFAATYAGLKLGGVDFPVGNPTIVTLVLLLGGLQLICIGILGQYIGRIYEEVKQRPRYIVARSAGFPGLDEASMLRGRLLEDCRD